MSSLFPEIIDKKSENIELEIEDIDEGNVNEEEVEADIGDANTATTINDIKRDVVIIAPRLLTGSEMPD